VETAIRPLEISDAESLVACFDRCYGSTYPSGVFRDAERIADRVREGTLCSVVAVSEADGVVGHMGITPRAPGTLTADAGNTVVDPSYRGQNVAARLSRELCRSCLEMGLIGFQHYPTTAHPIMQKLAVDGGGIEMGVLLDYIPAETSYVGFEASESASRGTERVAVVAVYQPLAEAPARDVWMPERHRELASTLYLRAGLARRLSVPRPGTPESSRSGAALVVQFETDRGLLRMEVTEYGPDLVQLVQAELGRRAAPTIIDLPLTDARADGAAESLGQLGFCFGAILPEYAVGGDVLRLQHVSAASLNASEPELANPEARELLAYTRQDARRGAA
jgi:GNAT superfamily N-acetyltransferase